MVWEFVESEFQKNILHQEVRQSWLSRDRYGIPAGGNVDLMVYGEAEQPHNMGPLLGLFLREMLYFFHTREYVSGSCWQWQGRQMVWYIDSSEHHNSPINDSNQLGDQDSLHKKYRRYGLVVQDDQWLIWEYLRLKKFLHHGDTAAPRNHTLYTRI